MKLYILYYCVQVSELSKYLKKVIKLRLKWDQINQKIINNNQVHLKGSILLSRTFEKGCNNFLLIYWFSFSGQR